MSAADKIALASLTLLVSTKTSDFNAFSGNHYRVDTSTSDVTVTLDPPSASNAGQITEFKKIAAANRMILSCTALIDGVSSESFSTQWTSIVVRSTGTTYDVI